MFIVINTDEEDKIIDFLKTQDKEKTQYFVLNNADQIQIGTKPKRTKKQLVDAVRVVQPKIKDTSSSSDCFITKNAKSYEEYLSAIRQKILEPNRLSAEMIDNIGYYYLNFINKKYTKSYPPVISHTPRPLFSRYEQDLRAPLFTKYKDIYHQIKSTINTDKEILGLPPSEHNLFPSMFPDIVLPFPGGIYSRSVCGILNRQLYPLLYYMDTFDIKINREYRFLDFLKSSLDIYGLSSHLTNGHLIIYVTPKPDDIFISDSITHCRYNDTYYCDGVSVPKWLYESKKEDLSVKQLEVLVNADERTLFIKKIGIENFIEQGTIIDSYENYPENEWWVKSEYKLIDMKNLLIQRQIVRGSERRNQNFKYAPFLCMKNQTTGDYHMEGVSPDCRNLYDALKMRYQLLDLPSYEIKNIK